jgi:hypothetical protein
MKARIFGISAAILFSVSFCSAQLPKGFSWVNLEADTKAMSVVHHALRDTSVAAIREVGIEGDYALVMTASRENGAPTPDYDLWSIYNVSLSDGTSQILVSGYGVRLLDWIGSQKDELAITYYNCWECEATTIFTTLRFRAGSGWTTRWLDKTQGTSFPQPGAVVLMTDVGDPYDDNIVDQVFAVVSEPNGGYAAGSWVHSRNTSTGKTEDDVELYIFDPKSDQDRVQKLEGQSALTL